MALTEDTIEAPDGVWNFAEDVVETIEVETVEVEVPVTESVGEAVTVEMEVPVTETVVVETVEVEVPVTESVGEAGTVEMEVPVTESVGEASEDTIAVEAAKYDDVTVIETNSYTDSLVDKYWSNYDDDSNRTLDIDEFKIFVQDICSKYDIVYNEAEIV